MWQQAGWFLQQIGGTWRWHVGGVDCDGGQAITGRWVHVVGTYDGRTARVFQDGVQVGEHAGPFKTEVFPGDLFIGQYSGGAGPMYQVHGRLANLKLYHRVLSATEITTAAKTSPP